jgi:flagellar hook-associated protein 1 FlgK
MGTSTLMNIGMRALSANAAALQTIGHNIANVNTPGYSRQQVDFATSKGQFTGAGFFGRGVDIATVTRVYDGFVTREALMSDSLAAMDATRAEQLAHLEQVFGTGEAGLGYAAGQVFNAMVDVASNPQDLPARQVVLSRAEAFASQTRAAAAQIDALQASVVNDVRSSVAEVNRLAALVAEVNRKISAASGSGHAPNDLLDQRDQLIGEIGKHIQVTTIAADDGSMNLFVAGGQRLVLGSQAQALKAVPDEFDPSRVRVAMVETNGSRPLDGAMLAGGRLAGLLRFQDEDLADAANRIGQLAVGVAGAVNSQQALGLDARQPPGSGAPLFGVGPARALAADANAGTASLAVSVHRTDAVHAADYQLAFDGADWKLTSPGSPGFAARTFSAAALAAGVAIDDLGITLGPLSGVAAVGDRFLVRPVARAAAQASRTLDDPRGIAAASPVTAVAETANRGTAAVAALRVADASIDASLRATIRFTSAVGDYDWELRDASNTLVGSGSATWSAGSPISLNGFELSLSGVPASGDTFRVEPTAFPAANNGNALALLALRDRPIVGGQTATDAYASAIADVGVRVKSAQYAADASASVANDAKAARASRSGVNLDEEAARLIQFQQSYQAAAKMLQVAQTVFDTLLQAAGH